MSWYNRRPAGSFYRPALFGGFRFFPPVIKGLLIANGAAWLLFDFLLAPFVLGGVPVANLIAEYLALWPLGPHFLPWQLVTYMFLHGGFVHLLFNMLALWMFGMELENTWGSRTFALFYLLCGLGGGVANLLVAPLVGQGAPTVGASGAVFGVLLAFGMMFPNRPIYLYFLVPIRAKYFVAAYIGLELFFGVTGTTDGVAHFAHLGGAAVGFLFVLAETNLIPVRALWRALRPPATPRYVPGGRVRREEPAVQDASFEDVRPGTPLSEDTEITQEMVDAILEKIHRSGYQSLTEDEKRILDEASKKIH